MAIEDHLIQPVRIKPSKRQHQVACRWRNSLVRERSKGGQLTIEYVEGIGPGSGSTRKLGCLATPVEGSTGHRQCYSRPTASRKIDQLAAARQTRPAIWRSDPRDVAVELPSCPRQIVVCRKSPRPIDRNADVIACLKRAVIGR